MKNRLTAGNMLVILTAVLGGCSVKDTMPKFEYPVYTPDKKWELYT